MGPRLEQPAPADHMPAGDDVRERAINPRDWEVRAIIEGRKTVTRRPVDHVNGIVKVTEFKPSDALRYDWIMRDRRMLWNDLEHGELLGRCPFGVTGDRLWVRETFTIHSHPQEGQGCGYWIDYKAGGFVVKGAWNPDPPDWWESCADGGWLSSARMPRFASSLTLEVVSVRVERLQEITEEDAIAEGCCGDWVDRGLTIGWEVSSAVEEFAYLWGIGHGKRYPWDPNPWVWRIEHKALAAEVDA